MESQDYFSLLSYAKQVDGTEEEILHRENSVTFSQAARMGFESAQIQQRKTTYKKSVPLTVWTWQPPILHLNVALFLKIRIPST